MVSYSLNRVQKGKQKENWLVSLVRLSAGRLECLAIGPVAVKTSIDLSNTAVDRVVVAEQSVAVSSILWLVGCSGVGRSVHGVRVRSSLGSSVVSAV